METTEIIALVNSGISALALFLSIILKRKSATASKTLEEIGEEAKARADKYIAKQCKKNKITLESKSEDNSNNNSNTTETVANN